MDFNEILQTAPYALDKAEKEKLLTERLVELTEMHRDRCPEYARMLESVGYSKDKVATYADLPYLPVRMFKELELKSVPDEELVKTMTSSGTTGQKVSKIYLDRVTSANQQKALVKIVNEFTGSMRMPMIILDCPSVVKDRTKFSARGAGILGFSLFGAKKIYALDDDMKLDVEGLRTFLDRWRGQTIFMFGFTFMVWQYFYKELLRLKDEGITFDFSNGVLIHGGGWKKLASEAVSPEEFHDRLQDVCGLDSIHDYYGMVEQTGCIYMQCECGHLHASIFSDVIARRPRDFSICDFGEPGILQVVSTIPESYPGHSLLTEDEGVILGEDDCQCGRKGKYFEIKGRIARAEIRGCSDTFAAEHAGDSESTKGSLDDGVLGRVDFLIGNRENVMGIQNLPVMKLFDDKVVDFLNDLSKKLMSADSSRSFPDIVTLGFWLRRASMLALKERFVKSDSLVGRGVAFHIAPSNVPVNYAYTLFTGLICGNSNVVRVPTKDFPQVRIINSAINDVLSDVKYQELRPYINLVRYERDREINDYFSAICDVRVIWGGDDTVRELRKSAIPVRAKEITFADRYSLAVIDSDTYLAMDHKERIASDFYNDTYLTDQNACTSPRVVVWTGSRVDEAQKIFWHNVYSLACEKYQFQAIYGVDKLSQLCLAASEYGDVCQTVTGDNVLYRVQVGKLDASLMDYRGACGYFYEYTCEDILDIRSFCDDTHCQTIALIGDRSIIAPILESGIKGVDRVVPMGRTMEFDLIWDGYNLVEELARNVSIL